VSQAGDDTLFDFFDEEPVEEPPSKLRGRLPRRGGRGSPPRPLAPLLRLGALVFLVLFLVLVFALLIDSCAGESRHSAYANYMSEVNSIAQQSSADGGKAVGVLTMPGLTLSTMASRLRTIASAEQQNLADAQGLAPPGRLRPENASLIQALELRVAGLQGLAAALAASSGSKEKSRVESRALSTQAYQLLASDVVWNDLFYVPAVRQLRVDGVGGVSVPVSRFLGTAATTNLFVTPAAMSQVLKRVTAVATTSGSCSGVHGTSLVSVEALPGGPNGSAQTLNTGSLNNITTTQSLVFRVTIQDSGNYQEVHIPVQLTIGRSAAYGGPITRTATVQLIDPGQQASVILGGNLNPTFAVQTTIDVNVKGVPCETNLTDNSAQYNVIFALPG
jgi:hypothetical protein